MNPAGPTLAVCLCIGIALGAPAAAAESWLGTSETITLRNGLTLLLAPDSAARTVDVAVWYDAGSRYDHPNKTGLAHLFEHLMFRGSTRYAAGEHGRRIRAEGGSSGATAASDFLSFHQTLPPDGLELAFQLEADRMTGLRLTQQGLEEERGQVAAERAQRMTPVSRGLERLYELSYPSHPYGRSLYGRASDLARITLDDLRGFYRAHFVPGRTLVTVVGNFRRDDAVALARQHLEPIRGGSRARPASPAAEKPRTRELRSRETHDAPVRILMVGWRGPSRSDPDWVPLSLLAPLLTRAVDAPLSRALIGEQPLCLSVQGDLDSRRDGSLFYLAAALHPSADSAETERRMLQIVEELASRPVSEKDLERAKRQVETSVWFGAQTSRGRAIVFGSGQMLAGEPRILEKQLVAIRSTTPADLQRAARLLRAEGRTVLWLVPSPAAGQRTPGPSGSGATGGGRP